MRAHDDDGAGALWTVSGGLASSVSLDQALAATPRTKAFSFLQISDSHVGFAKPANPDARAVLIGRKGNRQ